MNMQFITNMKTFSAIEYLAIDIANQFGDDKAVGFKGDKDEFENRIQWVRNNFKVLEQRAPEAEEPLLYSKAVMAFRKALEGKPIGHAVALDAVCSGMQLMSVLTGCHKGALITGLIDPEKRYDAYTEVTGEMNFILKSLNQEMLEVTRKQAKDAVMTALYGSKRTPKEIFGELLPVFFQAVQNKASGAFDLLEILRGTWNPDATLHTWSLPDGHIAHVPVMVEMEDRLQIAEYKYTMNVEYKAVAASDFGLANIANVVHSVDAYLLRTVVRKCMYNERQVSSTLTLLKQEASDQHMMDPQITKANNRFHATGMADISVIDVLSPFNVYWLDEEYKTALISTLERMVQYEPFDVITIHDSFAVHPNNCNVLRYWYRETLAELAESSIMKAILDELYGEDSEFIKDSENLAEYIRMSNYSLC